MLFSFGVLPLTVFCIQRNASGKGGARNKLTQEQNIALRSALSDYYHVLEAADVIKLQLGERLPKPCNEFVNNKIDELLKAPEFAGLTDGMKTIALQVCS